MLNLPVELKCIVISYLDVPPFCRLREACKWFCQDELWDIYLKNMNTKSKCLNDSQSSSEDKIRYIYQTRNIPLDKMRRPNFLYPYMLYNVNNYESRYNIQFPLDVKCYLVEISNCILTFAGVVSVDLNVKPTLDNTTINILLEHNDYLRPITLCIEEGSAYLRFGSCSTSVVDFWTVVKYPNTWTWPIRIL